MTYDVYLHNREFLEIEADSYQINTNDATFAVAQFFVGSEVTAVCFGVAAIVTNPGMIGVDDDG